MAMQVQNLIKNSVKLAGVRSISSGSGILSGGDQLNNKNSSNKLHLAVQRDYPKAASLPLPPNVDPAESTRFSPLRNRDINGSALVNHYSNVIDITLEQKVGSPAENKEIYEDPHVGCHDSSSPVSLNAVMQSMVPEPFSPQNFSHLNMPGGGWMQQSKFLSHELCSSHYTNLRQEVRSNWNDYGVDVRCNKGIFGLSLTPFARSSCKYFQINKRFISQNAKLNSNQKIDQEKSKPKSLTRGEQLKKAVRDYGSTVIVFHVALSLCSLGISYALVSSGLDVVAIINKIGLSEQLSSKVATNASTFVLAYAFHKLFAIPRIGITLTCAPFIVRYLRAKGILKAPTK